MMRPGRLNTSLRRQTKPPGGRGVVFLPSRARLERVSQQVLRRGIPFFRGLAHPHDGRCSDGSEKEKCGGPFSSNSRQVCTTSCGLSIDSGRPGIPNDQRTQFESSFADIEYSCFPG